MADLGGIFVIVNELFEEEPPLGFDIHEDHDVIPVLAAAGVLKREYVPRIGMYAEETINNYTDWDFKHHFRLGRATFETLLDKLIPALEPEDVRGKEAITPRKQLLIYMWYLANQDSMREISHLFDVAESSVNKVLKKVARAVVSLKDLFLIWPDADSQQDIAQSFAVEGGVQNCIGCIDGTHIRLAVTIGGDKKEASLDYTPDQKMRLHDLFPPKEPICNSCH